MYICMYIYIYIIYIIYKYVWCQLRYINIRVNLLEPTLPSIKIPMVYHHFPGCVLVGLSSLDTSIVNVLFLARTRQSDC